MLDDDARRDAFDCASHFREDFYACLTRRGDTLFELCDATLCENGPVTSPVVLTLLAEHRRGHGALYDALNCGRIDTVGLRRTLAVLPQPKAADNRLVLAVDVTHWLRPDAPCSPDRLLCHVYGRSGRSSDQLVPGWPYSFVAALETGRTSWCQLLDAVRLGPDDDVAEVIAAQARRVVTDVIAAGQCTTPRAWPSFWPACPSRWWARCAPTVSCDARHRPAPARPAARPGTVRSAGRARGAPMAYGQELWVGVSGLAAVISPMERR